MDRRDFIRLSTLSGLSLSLPSCFTPGHTPDYSFSSPNSKLGHLLREGSVFPAYPVKTLSKKTLIIGAGIGGLACGRKLLQNGHNDFLILDPEEEYGGNSRAKKNGSGSFPLAAHYLPLPNTDDVELLSFLQEIQVLKGFENELPVYDEFALCASPDERLLISNHWQDHLVPELGLSPEDKQCFQSFFSWIAKWKEKKGSDGKFIFNIPIAHTSIDPSWLSLDQTAFLDLVHEAGFRCDALDWYLDYCCLDDYGIKSSVCSAWAGLNYFCGRRGVAANASPGDVLTWPEGNAFLSARLAKNLDPHFSGTCMAYRIHLKDNIRMVEVVDEKNKLILHIECENIVMACPHFVSNKLLGIELPHSDHKPWLVANFQIEGDWDQGRGAPLAWDNVMYARKGLGYIHNNNQHLASRQTQYNLSHYIALEAYGISRKELHELNEDVIKELVWKDMNYAHPELHKKVKSVHIHVIGHGMAAPEKGKMFFHGREKYKALLPKGCFPAHADYSGYSTFEEAFYQGNNAAKELLASRKHI